VCSIEPCMMQVSASVAIDTQLLPPPPPSLPLLYRIPKCCIALTNVELGALTKMAKLMISINTLGPRHSSMVWRKAGRIDSCRVLRGGVPAMVVMEEVKEKRRLGESKV